MEPCQLESDGYCRLSAAVKPAQVERLRDLCQQAFDSSSPVPIARSSRGHVYAARNLLDAVPAIQTAWCCDSLGSFLRARLGAEAGLVRALFFDKPPDRTWALAWHKDRSIAVRSHVDGVTVFTQPTIKAGVPHLIAPDALLNRMLTLRIHLDDVDEGNGPLRVIPGSHRSSDDEGQGVEQAVPIHAVAGDVLAMRPLITHGSGASHPDSVRHRRILHLEFAADPILPDGLEWYQFIPIPPSRLPTGQQH